MMRLLLGVIVGLVVGAITTFWGMKALEVVDHATLDHYSQQSLQQLERERDEARIVAYFLAQDHTLEEIVAFREQQTGRESFEKSEGDATYLVAPGLALRYLDGELFEFCFEVPEESRDGDCIQLFGDV